jgi:C-terminal processing protease CtpA/Prc
MFMVGCYGYSATDSISKSQIKNLFFACKVWGLVKYHHPKVIAGKIDVDRHLIELLEKLDRYSPSKHDFNAILSQWFVELGELNQENQEYKRKTLDTLFEKNYNVDWIENEYFESQTKEYLANLLSNVPLASQYYVTSNPKVGNIEMANEKVYSLSDISDKNVALLIFFRYWNLVEYFYPYKYLIDDQWDDILIKYIPIFYRSKNGKDFNSSFLSLVCELDDSHANYYNSLTTDFFGKKYLPISFETFNTYATVTGYLNQEFAKANNLRLGDKIIEIDGVPITDRIKYISKYIEGSNPARKTYNFRYSLFNGNKDLADITIIRNTDTIHQTVSRYNYSEFNYEPKEAYKWEWPTEKILYLRLWLINSKDIKPIIKLMKNAESVIMDLRKYPKFDVHQRIVEILKKHKGEYFKKIVPELSIPGMFKFVETEPSGPKGTYQFEGNVAVLVNERTISYGEFLAMDLETCDNVVVIGTQTAGAVGFVSPIEVLEGFKTGFTGTGIFYPDMSHVQRKGVRIDQKIDRGKSVEDNYLRAAIDLLTKTNN